MSDFFTQPEPKMDPQIQSPEIPETIKVGEAEYSQAELEHLVGLGKIGDESEKTYKTKIDRVWPEFTKATQKNQALEAEVSALKAEKESWNKSQKSISNELSPEELRDQARKQGRELGLMFQEDFDRYYLERRSAERLIEDVKAVVKDSEQYGKPKTTEDAIFEHMQSTGIKVPEKAYKDMYETELKTWEQEQMKKVKPEGVYSIPSSTAGSKQPQPISFVGMKQDQLAKLVSEAFSGNQ